MKPQGVLFFSMPVDEDAERRQNGGVFPDYFRVPVGASWKMSVTDRFPKDRKPWNKAKKQSITVIMRGAHDDGSHNPKCLMGLRPGGNAAALAIVRMSRKRYAKLAAHSR